MDLSRALAAHRLVALDTPVLIYALEQHVHLGPPARLVLEAVAAGTVSAVASTLLLAELLVVPYRTGAAAVAGAYLQQLEAFPHLTLVAPDVAICRRAAELRATHAALKLPDALHVATALESGATAFVTNDARLPALPGLAVLWLQDFV